MKLPLPTPLPVGKVNVYLAPAAPITLIDAGPNTPAAYDTLARQLRGRGLSVGDVEQVVLTHGHVDHAGLGGIIQRDSDARVLVHALDFQLMRMTAAEDGTRERLVTAALEEAGVPAPVIEQLSEFNALLRSLTGPLPNVRELHGGERLSAGRWRFEVLHTPGHSPGSICLFSPQSRILVAGDTLLHHITPNAFALAGDMGAKQTYLATLRRLEGLDTHIILSGHGRNFPSPRPVTSRYFREYEQRRAQLRASLMAERRTPFELVEVLFGHLDPANLILAVSEVMGYLHILEVEGLVQRVRDGVSRYGSTGA